MTTPAESPAPLTVVFGIGVTEDVLSPESQHLSGVASAGRREVDRLMGSGRAFGEGPLPRFLRGVAAARRKGGPVGLILFRDGSDPASPGLVAPLADLIADARVVATPGGLLPGHRIRSALRAVTGFDPEPSVGRPSSVRFLVVGCHTEHRVLTLALYLRTVLMFADVAVCSHLVGSATAEAHFAALRHNLPRSRVRVLLDLREAAAFAGIESEPLADLGCTPCAIEPAEARDALGREQIRIIELLCMHWTSAHLRPLQGGYSGSLLFLASGWRGRAQTEPLVLKVDQFSQMRREIDGYHEVKGLLGKHVPTFDYPVADGDFLGVGMELATMEGDPSSLQDAFEAAEDEGSFARFLQRLDRALGLLSAKLYRNTSVRGWISPYRSFWLHADNQIRWLNGNLEHIARYYEEDVGAPIPVDTESLGTMLAIVAANEDSVDSEVSITHGDLNCQNVICDEGGNVWFVDWTHSARSPVELDFCKLENDVKFVMSKQFDREDLPRLRRLEEYLVAHRVPADLDRLPEDLRFVKWDLRFRKIVESVSRIRKACFDLKETDAWLVYRAGLLRYSLHSLSFDRRRGRGECGLFQLMHALFSVDALLQDLVTDDFHLRIRGERPMSYPPRQRVSIDVAPWTVACPEYDPPYHVDPSVLAGEQRGWADPEDLIPATAELAAEVRRRDEDGRPLNPRGRTGIAGRGLLGRWGPNLSVVAVVTRRAGGRGDGTEILLGRLPIGSTLELPKGFALPGETPDVALLRILEFDTGWRPQGVESVLLSQGYSYDPRQTDHAWVLAGARLLDVEGEDAPHVFRPGGRFEEVSWKPLASGTVNNLPAAQAHHVRSAIERLRDADAIAEEHARALLEATG